MNIFEYYLIKINKLVTDNKNDLKLNNLQELKNVNLEVPPNHFNFDLSTNISLVLAKSNNLKPDNLANKIKDLISKSINHFEEIVVAGPGFLNIKLSKEGMITNINKIFEIKESYGSKKKMDFII